jgi:hypothetical protein
MSWVWISVEGHEGQINLKFKTKEMAIEYAKNNGYEFKIKQTKQKSIPKKSYAENFTS